MSAHGRGLKPFSAITHLKEGPHLGPLPLGNFNLPFKPNSNVTICIMSPAHMPALPYQDAS